MNVPIGIAIKPNKSPSPTHPQVFNQCNVASNDLLTPLPSIKPFPINCPLQRATLNKQAARQIASNPPKKHNQPGRRENSPVTVHAVP